eukprot:5417636-Heterocapsa_arctica.AAC.1
MEVARVASDAQSIVQRENVIVDKTRIEELKRKCDDSAHDRGLLRAELDVAARALGPRVDGEHPEILMFTD